MVLLTCSVTPLAWSYVTLGCSAGIHSLLRIWSNTVCTTYCTKNSFTHKEATVQTWNSLDVGWTDGRTDWQAGGLPLFTLESTRRRLCVATLLISRQPDTSNSLRIFCPTFFRSLFLSSRFFTLLSSLVHSS
jgi:hypothetical protein